MGATIFAYISQKLVRIRVKKVVVAVYGHLNQRHDRILVKLPPRCIDVLGMHVRHVVEDEPLEHVNALCRIEANLRGPTREEPRDK